MCLKSCLLALFACVMLHRSHRADPGPKSSLVGSLNGADGEALEV